MRIFNSPEIIMSGVGESGSESRNENFCKL